MRDVTSAVRRAAGEALSLPPEEILMSMRIDDMPLIVRAQVVMGCERALALTVDDEVVADFARLSDLEAYLLERMQLDEAECAAPTDEVRAAWFYD